jgi:hypothetical protein
VILLAHKEFEFTECPHCAHYHFIGCCFRHSFPIIPGVELNWSGIDCQCSNPSIDLFTLRGATVQRIEWFEEVLEAGISWYQFESIVQLILALSRFRVFEPPMQQVFN